MGDKENFQIISKCLFSFRFVDCSLNWGSIKPCPYYTFVTVYLYPASCLIGRHYPTRIQCWKTMAMMLLMASSSCPVSNGMAPLISHHQILRRQKPVSFSRILFNTILILLSFSLALSCSQAPITLNLRDLRKRRSPAHCLWLLLEVERGTKGRNEREETERESQAAGAVAVAAVPRMRWACPVVKSDQNCQFLQPQVSMMTWTNEACTHLHTHFLIMTWVLMISGFHHFKVHEWGKTNSPLSVCVREERCWWHFKYSFLGHMRTCYGKVLHSEKWVFLWLNVIFVCGCELEWVFFFFNYAVHCHCVIAYSCMYVYMRFWFTMTHENVWMDWVGESVQWPLLVLKSVFSSYCLDLSCFLQNHATTHTLLLNNGLA